MHKLLLRLGLGRSSAFESLEARYRLLENSLRDSELCNFYAKQSIAAYDEVIRTRAFIISQLEARIAEQERELGKLESQLAEKESHANT